MKSDELSKLVKSCRLTLEKAEEAAKDRKEQNKALYYALQETLEIWKRSKNSPNALKRVFKEFGVKELREGTNPLNRFVRLCLPSRKPNDYNRYASALSYFESEGWNSAKIDQQIEKHSLTYFSDRGRTRQNKVNKSKNAGTNTNVVTAKELMKDYQSLVMFQAKREALAFSDDNFTILICKKRDRTRKKSIFDNIDVLVSFPFEDKGQLYQQLAREIDALDE